MDLTVFVIGIGTLGIWWYGAVWAWWRKRSWVMWGLFLAGLFSLPFTFVSAGLYPSEVMLGIAGACRVFVAALLVGGFRAAQPTHVERPAKWRP